MKRHLIYIVEDDEGIQELYRGAFEDSYDVEIFNSGEEFFERYKVCRPDLAILDIMLPGDDGFKVLTDLRKTDELLPVIIVSAKNDELSFVKGLNKGADDYMSKPFSVLELMARVRANLRRTAVNILRVRNIEIDSNTYAASVGGEKIELTLKEFLLLKLLAENAGVTLTREKLFTDVWGEDFMGETRTLDMHIAALREKLSAHGETNAIVTVRGVGYRLDKNSR